MDIVKININKTNYAVKMIKKRIIFNTNFFNHNILFFMKNILIVLSLTIFQSSLFSQVPGYLGKRIYVKANLSSMLALSNPSASNSYLFSASKPFGKKSGSIGFNNVFNIDIGYALSRRKAIVGNIGYLKTGVVSSAYTPSLSPIATERSDFHLLFYHVTGLTVGIGLQNFRLSQGAIAPFGNYGGWSLNYYHYTGDIVDKTTDYADNIGRHAKLGTDPKMFDFVLGYEWGFNAIQYDKLVLSFGYKISLSYQWLAYKIKPVNEFENIVVKQLQYYGTNQSTFENDVAQRMFYHNLFAIKMGVGFVY
jgi:hypothetical protein